MKKIIRNALLLTVIIAAFYCKKDDAEDTFTPQGYWKGVYGSGTNTP